MEQLIPRNVFETALENSICSFIESIISLCELSPYSNSKLRKKTPRFSNLKPHNNAYYQLQYYEDQIDKHVRGDLLLGFFREVFQSCQIDCEWPEIDTTKINVGFSYATVFEFILINNNKAVGYSFNDIFFPETVSFINSFNVIDHIEVIEWTDNLETVSSINSHVDDELANDVIHITFREFFCRFFSENDYNDYISKVKEAIKNANQIVGLQTIPQLTLSNLSELKNKSASDIGTHVFAPLAFIPLSNSTDNKMINYHFNQVDYQRMYNNFITKKYYLALLGKHEFARCFITSEYLLSVFNEDSSFDYTSVAAGYIKAVEQLLYHLTLLTLDSNPQDLWIKKNSKTGNISQNDIRDNPYFKNKRYPPKQVRFKKELEAYFDISLGPLYNFLCDNKEAWNISPSSVESIRKILGCYSRYCRNDFFHKENITTFKDIEAIRNNTLLVCFLVLGAYCVPQMETRLGIIDASFENLYRRLKVIPKSQDRFWISFDGETYLNTIRLIDQPHPIYDSSGSLQESQIEFVIVDSLDNIDYEEFYSSLPQKEKLIIKSNNIPKEIWLYKRLKKEMVKIDW